MRFARIKHVGGSEFKIKHLTICLRPSASRRSFVFWQSQGLPVEFRPDINALALLGIELRTSPRATELPA